MATSYTVEDYLEHHGILGQKWGKRNGPPYPLGSEDHSAREKKAGWRKSLGKSSSKSDDKKRKESVSNAKKTNSAVKQKYNDAKQAYNLAKNRYDNSVFSSKEKRSQYKAALNKAKKDLVEAQKELNESKADVKKAKETGTYDKEVREKQSMSERHRENLKRKYMNQGMSEAEANAAVEKRIKIEKTLAITAGVTVAAIGTYAVANKLGKKYCDGILKKGIKFQTIAGRGDKEFNRAFYTSYKHLDKIKYGGLYSHKLKMDGQDVYKYGLTSSKDIKIASQKTAAKIFNDLYEKDSDFRDSLKSLANDAKSLARQTTGMQRKKWLAVADIVSNDAKTRMKSGYEGFNFALAGHGMGWDDSEKKFYDALKNAGYHAIYDINDMKFSGYRTSSPLIVFDPTTVVKSVVDKMGDSEIANLRKQSYNILAGQEFMSQYGAYLAADAAIFAGSVSMAKNQRERLKELDRKVEEEKKK